jgi:hypothetical protein
MSQTQFIQLTPIVSWPREVRVGEVYAVTADLKAARGQADWPYPEEEFEVTCMLDGLPFLETTLVGSSALLLHRFGGTYRPVEFTIRALEEPPRGYRPSLSLSFVNSGGTTLETAFLSVTIATRREVVVRESSPPARPQPDALTRELAPPPGVNLRSGGADVSVYAGHADAVELSARHLRRAGHPAAIDHLRDLGVTAVELLPGAPVRHDRHLGSSAASPTTGATTPSASSPPTTATLVHRGEQVPSSRRWSGLHEAGIEVILDVVYNHTAEGNHLGPTLSLPRASTTPPTTGSARRPALLHGLHRLRQHPEHATPACCS